MTSRTTVTRPALKPPTPQRPRLSRVARWMAFLGVTALSILVLMAFPVEWTALIFVALVAGSLAVAGISERRRIAGWLRDLLAALWQARRTAALPRNLVYETPIPPVQFAVEIIAVVLAALVITTAYRIDNPTLKLRGGEAEWLTSSAYLAANSLRDYGYIPLWQPYLEWGEPLIDQPFSFVLNPITAGPSLLVGGLQGIKYSVVLTVIVAGLGGWFMGRVLGLGGPGRVLLALLMIGKGNMQAMIGTGYYQLGVTQSYFPWIIGGTLAVLRTRKRWPIVLTALAFALMFFGGNIWYTLPMLLSMLLLGAAHLLSTVYDSQGQPRLKIHWERLWRLAFTLLLTAGLCAVTFIPIFAHRHLIGGHPDEPLAGQIVDIGWVIGQYFDGSMQPYDNRTAPGGIQFYYSFVTPLWFAALIFVIIPPIWPFTHRPAVGEGGRIWISGLVMILFATSWGTGGNYVFIWLYDHVPLMGQWRFVGRALAVSSFWIGVLVAMRADGLWRAILALGWPRIDPFVIRSLRGLLASGLLAACLVTGYQVNMRWNETAPLDPINVYDNTCIDWLRAKYPDRELSVYLHGYQAVTTFMDNRARLFPIEADYFPIHLDNTIGFVDLVGFDSMPEFALPWTEITRAYLTSEGYYPLRDSPIFGGRYPCIWRKPDALSYAYTVTMSDLLEVAGRLPRKLTTPVEDFVRLPDQITLWVEAHPTEPLVLTIQELAYPGWEVWIDDQPAKLEVLGGQVAAVIDPAILPITMVHKVQFQYRPPLLFFGGAVTLLSAVFSLAYLARGERLFGWIGRRLWRWLRRGLWG